MDMNLRWLCKEGKLNDAVDHLDIMDNKGLQAHPSVIIFLLEACINSKLLELARYVHSYMVTKGINLSLFLNTRLIDLYAKHGSIDMASEVFEQVLQRDVVVYNALIAGYARLEAPCMALELLSRMEQDGILPDEATFVSVLKACGRLRNLEKGRQVHVQMVKVGARQDITVQNTLIDVYAKCGSMTDAHGIFESMPSQSVVSWTATISGYANHGYGEEALTLFYDMMKSTVIPDDVTYLSVIHACAMIGNLEQAMQIQSHIKQSSVTQTMAMSNALIDMFSKCGSVEHALQVFNEMSDRDLISWSAIIAAYAKVNHFNDAFESYKDMRKAGINPNEVIYRSIFNACAGLGALDEGKEIHSFIHKAGLNPDILTESTLVNMYAKGGCIESAREIFDRMGKRDAIAWNSMTTGYCQRGHVEEAWALFNQMKQEGLEPDEVTFMSMLNACAGITALDKGRELHVSIDIAWFKSDPYIGSALVDMYCKCGDVHGARNVFYMLPSRDIVVWTALLTGYAQHGWYIEAFYLLNQIHKEGLQLNEVAFLKVLSACSFVGCIEEACFLFAYMIEEHGIKPSIEHYTCIVDLLGRAGCLEQAGYIITEMTCRPNEEIWMALLGACRIYGHVELAESVGDCMSKFMPPSSSAYVLLRNIYNAAEMWTYQGSFERQ